MLHSAHCRGIEVIQSNAPYKLIIRAITFKDGKYIWGGGVEIRSGAIVDIDLCIFLGCSSTGTDASNGEGGGAIYIWETGTTVNVYGTAFIGNTAFLDGNDVYNWPGDPGTSVTIHDTCPAPYSLNTPDQGE